MLIEKKEKRDGLYFGNCGGFEFGGGSLGQMVFGLKAFSLAC